ncbi:MAG TPA: alkaline shock response membrane anchor protein AmaP [Mycobacterium sp.]|nr:alkaline shock response membrane anchor protein AmaP [Mycobacterium sp.]
MHADRTNRALLIVFAVLLVSIGLVGALNGFGAFGVSAEHAPLFANPVGLYVGRHGVWLWPVIAAAAGVVALLALRWLSVLVFSTDRAAEIQLTGDRSAGRTTVVPAALTEAVAQEIEGYPGVHSARARLIGQDEVPRLVITAVLDQDADASRTRRHIETSAVAHARQALENPDLPVILDLTVTASAGRRLTEPLHNSGTGAHR